MSAKIQPCFERDYNPAGTRITLGDVVFGGVAVPVIAGPCAVEGAAQIHAAARAVAAGGASALRGGAYKPRTSPYSFQGLGPDGVEILAEAGAAFGLPVVTEVMAVADIEAIAARADVLQIGARNMQNQPLLRAVGQTRTPVLLKRGLAASLDELLWAAEYVLAGGNTQVMLCLRGVRTFGTHTRNTLDIGAIPVLKERTHLPVIVDPSHAAGKRELVPALARAAIAAGADGLMVEVHPDPAQAMSDGRQSLTPESFAEMMVQLEKVAHSVGRRLGHTRRSRVLKAS
jgi:3-deoxy-7-phosphoheptulonate synthase